MNIYEETIGKSQDAFIKHCIDLNPKNGRAVARRAIKKNAVAWQHFVAGFAAAILVAQTKADSEIQWMLSRIQRMPK